MNSNNITTKEKGKMCKRERILGFLYSYYPTEDCIDRRIVCVKCCKKLHESDDEVRLPDPAAFPVYVDQIISASHETLGAFFCYECGEYLDIQSDQYNTLDQHIKKVQQEPNQ